MALRPCLATGLPFSQRTRMRLREPIITKADEFAMNLEGLMQPCLKRFETFLLASSELLRTPSTRSSGRSRYITATSPVWRSTGAPTFRISSKCNITGTSPIDPLKRHLPVQACAKAGPPKDPGSVGFYDAATGLSRPL